jgi:hypothetical protein
VPVAGRPPELVANPVQDGLSQIRLQCSAAARLKLPQPLKRLDQCFLDKVVRIGHIAGPSRKPAPGPATQRRVQTGEQMIEGLEVATASQTKQLRGRCQVVWSID